MSKRCLGCMELFGDEFEICPHCGYIVGTGVEEAIHMEPGTLLYDRYIVGKVLGYGGFGVTYLGWDGKLEQKVAIKEYLPSEFSTRMPGQSQVTVFRGEKSEQFYDGLRKFVEEAKRLAKFQNEHGIVKIFDSFEENDTAYIIMEYLDGETLTSYLKREKTIPEDVAVSMMMPVMESLQIVHDAGLLHRDIAPDNIFLTNTGEVKLIDFGASRYATTSHSRSLTVIIKPGYSPEEQYRSRGDQGPHTDVYAIASTLYKMITGKTPPDAMERRAKYENQNKDILEEPHKINKNISLQRENAILNAMNVRIEDRTPDIATFIKDLNAEPPVKRVYGKIKKIDLYSWPLWLKIAFPVLVVGLLTIGVLLTTGVIRFTSVFSENIVVPEGIVIVPDFEGMNRDEAWQLAKNSKLNPVSGTPVESEYVAPGKIILQTPNVGSYLEAYGNVILSVSAGKIEEFRVPSCVDFTLDDALARLAQAGYTDPEIEYDYSDVDEGKVIRQSPEAGTQTDSDTRIVLVVSKGLAPFAMPSLIGMTQEEAKQVLLNCGRNLETVTFSEEYSNDPTGTVIRQEPTANAEVTNSTPITVIVSAGDLSKSVVVENVIGKSKEDAISILEGQGFTVSVTEAENETEVGKVFLQIPTGGASAEKGSTVSIMVSRGKKAAQTATVPNVAGKSESEAMSTLKKRGFTVSVTQEYSDSVAEGNVIRQNPSGGSSASSGSTVTITVSRGKESAENVIVTNVVGKSESEATTILESQGFTVSVTQEYSDSVAEGNVIRQNPGGGSSVSSGSTVTITVSRGKEPSKAVVVSDVVGKIESEATSILKDQGFTVTVNHEYSDTVTSGYVIRQNPVAGSTRYAGDTIEIIVSKGKETSTLKITSISVKDLGADGMLLAVESTSNYKITDFSYKVGGMDGWIAPNSTTLSWSDTYTCRILMSYERGETVPEKTLFTLSVTIKDESGNTVTGSASCYVYTKYWAEIESPITVSNVVGVAQNTAESTLRNQGFKVKVTEEYSDTVASGKVISQNPAAGSTAYTGDTVTIVVSLGKKPITVVNVVGVTKLVALNALKLQGFKIDVTEDYSETVESGKVISQNPAAGSTAYAGDTVTIVVSLGKKPVTVSNVVGTAQSTAESTLRNQGFNVKVAEEYSDTVKSGYVIRQNPAAGLTRYAGDTIEITVSKGKEPSTLKITSISMTDLGADGVRLAVNATSNYTITNFFWTGVWATGGYPPNSKSMNWSITKKCVSNLWFEKGEIMPEKTLLSFNATVTDESGNEVTASASCYVYTKYWAYIMP